ncbi:MAG: hypothetical protein J5604_00890 [Bacteroidales bacterium]|nr:hypothetical protein [Bacteroidales bacterium]
MNISLNPIERTLYNLFLAHPEGIHSDNLVLHWKELCITYSHESHYDDPDLREEKIESLCAESKTVFYTNVSRIKKKFVKVLGSRNSKSIIIRRDQKSGLYKISNIPKARLFYPKTVL